MSELEKVKFFHNGGLCVEYGVWGQGPEVLFAFHGFGRTYSDFIGFTEPLTKKYTIYGINIFFHGESNIGDRNVDKNPIQPQEFAFFFEAFIQSLEKEKVALMGYSLGGRIAMKIAELIPQRINSLILFAPDGLVVNRWYAMFSHYKLGRTFFRFFIRHNTGFYKLLDILNNVGIISDRLKEFVINETSSQEKQWKVYKVWSFLRNTDPDLEKLTYELKNKQICTKIFIGSYDNIIPFKNTLKIKELNSEIEVYSVKSGHALLSKKVMKEIFERKLIIL